MIITINYSEGDQVNALMTYAAFRVNVNSEISGVQVLKQVAVINNLPFELKSIFGLESEMNAVESVIGDDRENVEEKED